MVGCYSEYWKEAEKLVAEGLVRVLMTNNLSIHQIDTQYEFSRYNFVMSGEVRTAWLPVK